MKELKIFVTLFALSLFAIGLNAQESEYKVFYFSGSPKIVEKGKEISVKRDTYLNSKASIKLPANSYLVLTNKNEVPMGISNPGTYSIADLNKIYENVGNSNLTQEFFDYIANNMIQESDKARRSGGVYRAVGDILIAPFDEAVLLIDSLTLTWKNPKQKKLYLKVYNPGNWELIYNIPTTDSTYTLFYEPQKFIKGREYAWTVYHGEDHPQQGTILRVFTFADDAWKEEFYDKLKVIKENGENVEINKIKTLRLYLDNNIYPLSE